MTGSPYYAYLVGDGDRRARHYVALSALCALVAVVLLARWMWDLPVVVQFVQHYPGQSSGLQSAGTPVWVVALHALNLFFIAQLVRSGWAIHTARRPIGHWTPRGRREPVTLEQWFHVALDLAWVVSGAVFIALMFISGRWTRIVPTNWDVVPNAVSVALAYLSLHWPAENSWQGYNALQLLAYFLVVFVLAPVAALTGWRLSFLWPRGRGWQRLFPIEAARKAHFAVMVCFVGFVVVHVGMIGAGGPVHLLNHMFAANDGDSLAGVAVLGAVLVVTGLAIVAARPVVIRTLAGLTGKVTR